MADPRDRWESLVAPLVPHACREHVLGDLYEESDTARDYWASAIPVLVWVWISQIRRTSDPGVVLAQVGALYVSFLGAALWMAGGSLLADPTAVARLAVPVAAAAVALVLRDAYVDPTRPAPHVIVDAGFATLVAIAFQVALRAARSDLVLPAAVVGIGGVLAVPSIAVVRVLLRSSGTPKPRS